MKFKLNKSQLQSLLNLFQQICSLEKPDNFEARLLYVILEQIKSQLIKKSADTRKKYIVSFTDHESLAFFIFFKKFHFFTPETLYEATMVNLICNQIHSHHSNPI